MTNREPASGDIVLVAVDVSKLRNDVLIEVPDKIRRRRSTAQSEYRQARRRGCLCVRIDQGEAQKSHYFLLPYYAKEPHARSQ
jgi:hypothetical protein